jgi:dTDP-4-dehydrorhamnose 3,5-epimerase
VRRLATNLDGPALIEPTVHGDERGFFVETFRATTMSELGIHEDWVQDNHSRSTRGVLRGMHFQPGQAKLIRCARGAIFDVLVDIRPDSPSFGRWESFELDDSYHRELYVPDGFAHGFCVLSDTADVVYRCSAYYDAARESGFRYDDPDVAIEWPSDLGLQTSERDRTAPTLRELELRAPA